jgi:homoserine dehydrogenase
VHSAFFLSDQTISIGIVGLRSQASKNGIGKELLAQYDQQSSYLKMRFNVDIRIRAIATVDNMMVLGQDNGSIKASEVEDKSRFVTFDEAAFRKHVCADHLPHWLIIDVSDNVNYVENYYSTWLSSRTHVISANVNVAACSASRYSTTSAKTCEKEVILDIEACVAVGVPIISTLRNFLQTGDCVQRVEFSSNAFLNSLLLQSQQYGKTKSFEALLKEQFKKFKKNLSVEEILDDLRGIVCAKRAILITRELGYCSELNQVEVRGSFVLFNIVVFIHKYFV